MMSNLALRFLRKDSCILNTTKRRFAAQFLSKNGRGTEQNSFRREVSHGHGRDVCHRLSRFNDDQKRPKLCKAWILSQRVHQVIPTTLKHRFFRFQFSRPRLWHVSRNFSDSRNSYRQKNKTTAIYTIALVIVVLGGSYAAVPLYRIFCQASGLGGTVQQTDASDKIKNMTTRKDRLVTVRFNADKSATMQWSFKPQQPEVKVYPGETALAFYTAKNPTDFPITGISTYNVIPFEAGQYFNKIQCFCFEEQRLNPHEQVDMPVFFYIDPEFLDDPALYKVDTITLSYTFFQAKEAQDFGIQ